MTSIEFMKPKSYYDIPGFFWWLDRKLFSAVLEAQRDQPPGDIVEMGTSMGKSTVILGNHLRDGERLVALDLFGSDAETDQQNQRENKAFYSTLTRDLFERYYLSLHDQLPDIVQAPSSDVLQHVEPDQARFVHVDASHLYHHVCVDVQSTKKMLRPGGLAVFDDYRSEHTPGVSAAVWEAVFKDGFVPLAVTPMKMYGVFEGDPEPYIAAMRSLVAEIDEFRSVDEDILGRNVMRITMTSGSKKKATVAAPAISDDDVARIADEVARRLTATSAPVESLGARARAVASPSAIRAAVDRRRWPGS